MGMNKRNPDHVKGNLIKAVILEETPGWKLDHSRLTKFIRNCGSKRGVAPGDWP